MDSTNPNNSPDQVKESANHHRGIKSAVQGSFPNLGQQAVTKTAAEINDLVQPATTDTLSNKTISSAAFTGTQTGFNGDVDGDLTGNVVGNTQGTHTGAVVGNASTASNFNSNRTITISGDASGSNASSSGTHNIGITLGGGTVQFANEMNKNGGGGTYVVSNSSEKILSAGVFNISGFYNDGYGTIAAMYIKINGSWAAHRGAEFGDATVQIVSDGTNVKLTSSGGQHTFEYTKMFN